MRSKFIAIFLITIFLIVGISPVFSQTPATVSSNPRLLVKQGESFYRQQQLSTAIEYLQKAAQIFAEQKDKPNQAITLTNLGRLQFEFGKANDALNNWQTAETIYIQLGDKIAVTSNQIYQASALQKLGFLPRACGILLQSLEIDRLSCDKLNKDELEKILQENKIHSEPDILLIGWRSLGDVLRATGKLNESRYILETVAKNNSPSTQAGTLLSLANTYMSLGNLQRDRFLASEASNFNLTASQQDNYRWGCFQNNYTLPLEAIKEYKNAESKYQEVIKISSQPIATKAKINLLNLLLTRSKFKSTAINDTNSLLSQANSLLSDINIANSSPNQNQIYNKINLATAKTCLIQLTKNKPDWEKKIKELSSAQSQAEIIQDDVAKSYAIGNLGSLYEYRAWWLKQNLNLNLNSNNSKNKNISNHNLCKTTESCLKKAYQSTQQALYFAQPTKQPFIAYQWQSQLGHILEEQGKKDNAITAYNKAINTLESVRYNLLTTDSDVQFSFLENVEPVYRRLLDLLLQTKASEKNLLKATEVSESLQLAELENLLRCRLDTAKTVPINKFEQPPAAIIHPIIIQNRIEVIARIPSSNKLLREQVDISQTKFNQFLHELENLRSSRKFQKQEYIEPAKKLYEYLIKPFENDLPDEGTLVFIVDSTLQSLPFAALYDEKQEQYLIQKYSIAVNVASKLLNQRNLKPKQRSALLAGISEEAKSFVNRLPELFHVEDELAGIEKTVSNQVLKNEQFTSEALKKQMAAENYPFIHLATHGQFSSNREQTYIYAWHNKIKLDELEELLRSRRETSAQPIELLVLSACETAKGDKRAALGIAGVALKAEARSTVASLWQVNDESTADFMKQFYQELNKPNMTKAEALRKVQVNFLNHPKYNHPYHWAPFILVGNWL
ncbi:MAG: CHAT domain-containing protein [Rivularia sp. (in: Bacteria)]|nr:CHAT domain-containing protein [Rivularia sp. MS3]